MREPLRWVRPGEPLPDPRLAFRQPNGLLAAGTDLDAHRLLQAYRSGIFPWYSDGQPVLWWSPDPRMVLYLDEFRIKRSLAKTIRRWAHEGGWQVRLDQSFDRVMMECAAPRSDQEGGTWITPQIRAAYGALHGMGHAHCVEVWRRDASANAADEGELVAGLYGVSIGRMFFGESMFTRVPDASKVALAALVQALSGKGFRVIDCQQNTRHLASLGAREIDRETFLAHVTELGTLPAPDWRNMRIAFPQA